jgi:hypothetical protein
VQLTSEHKVQPRQDPHFRHDAPQALLDDTQAHTDYQEQEKAERVSSGIQDRHDKEESQGGGSSSVFVDVAVVPEISDHFDDQENDSARNVVLHGPDRQRGKNAIRGSHSQKLITVLDAEESPSAAQGKVDDTQQQVKLAISRCSSA